MCPRRFLCARCLFAKAGPGFKRGGLTSPSEKKPKAPGNYVSQNALDLSASGELWLEDHGTNPNISVVAGPRIGIGDRHDAVHWPLRFGVRDHPALSPPRFES